MFNVCRDHFLSVQYSAKIALLLKHGFLVRFKHEASVLYRNNVYFD